MGLQRIQIIISCAQCTPSNASVLFWEWDSYDTFLLWRSYGFFQAVWWAPSNIQFVPSQTIPAMSQTHWTGAWYISNSRPNHSSREVEFGDSLMGGNPWEARTLVKKMMLPDWLKALKMAWEREKIPGWDHIWFPLVHIFSVIKKDSMFVCNFVLSFYSYISKDGSSLGWRSNRTAVPSLFTLLKAIRQL